MPLEQILERILENFREVQNVGRLQLGVHDLKIVLQY